MSRKSLEIEQKALEINLDDSIYGTLAEIGAGQEVARYFFKVGASSGTIAKTMSAYDKVYSDIIYGAEVTGRYVCESRLYKMLDHEYELMETRLGRERPESCFFTFADTITALNYKRTVKGHGWLGIRFQLHPEGEANDIVMHVKMLDNDNQLQQQAIGILGVNLIYACYRYYDDAETLVESLIDHLKGRIRVDMIRITGPNFQDLDNRLLSLMLVKHGLCNVAMFDSSGKNIHASEFLYKKAVLVVRGSFRPITLVNQNMLKTSLSQFKKEPDVDPRKAYLLTEITLDNLKKDGDLDYQDFLDRVDLLCALGQRVIISNCEDHKKLINYLSDYKVTKLGIVLGVQALLDIVIEKFDENQDGRLLLAFGELFTRNVKIYVFPALQEGSSELMNSRNVPIPEGIRFLYKHLLDSGQIVDVAGYDKELLHIFSTEVLQLVRGDEPGWEAMVPAEVAALIKEKCLFGFPCQRMEFEY